MLKQHLGEIIHKIFKQFNFLKKYKDATHTTQPGKRANTEGGEKTWWEKIQKRNSSSHNNREWKRRLFSDTSSSRTETHVRFFWGLEEEIWNVHVEKEGGTGFDVGIIYCKRKLHTSPIYM